VADKTSGLSVGIMDLVRNHPGGLTGLIQKLRADGAAEIVDSWVSWEENLPISPTQIKSALGVEPIEDLAGKTGVSIDTASDKLAELLPILVNRMIPKEKDPARRKPAGGPPSPSA
jgi:uncharacterized protein YidB (DUF937 family)